jgi:hypothetical protein
MSTDLTAWPESPCLGRHVAELEAKAIGVDVSRRLAIDCRQMQRGRLDGLGAWMKRLPILLGRAGRPRTRNVGSSTAG